MVNIIRECLFTTKTVTVAHALAHGAVGDLLLSRERRPTIETFTRNKRVF